jgi:putative ABC transport system permease protein
VLKMKIKLAGSNFFTKFLVTIQFIVSAALIISTLVILNQLHFMQSKNPGFNKENVLVIDASGLENTKRIYGLLKTKLNSVPGIIGTASAELSIGEGEGWSESGFKYNGKDRLVYEFFIDHDYMNVLGMKLIAGRNFDLSYSSDTTTSVIVNESLVKDFGWNINNAVGQPLKGYSEKFTPIVIGVIKDFNYLPFSQPVQPQLFQQFSSYNPYKFFVRLTPGNPSATISKIETIWKFIEPDYPLKYSFLDQNIDRFYKSEARWSNIVGWAGGISIFLACLGLFGLAALVVVNRTKEIGIRKVLGASVPSILTLVSKDFLKLVTIAFLVACPIAWYLMNKWLMDYPYRIQIEWWVFGITAAMILLVAMLTISFQAMKAAVANPVRSIMTE